MNVRVRFHFFKLLAFSVACVLLIGASTRTEVPGGFTPLFNGKDLTGWKGLVGDPNKRAAMSEQELATAQEKANDLIRAHWKVVDGILEYDGQGSNLCTSKEYGDFELHVDWKICSGGDSGVYLRGSPQVQIWDTDYEPCHGKGAEKGSGALWNNQRYLRLPLVKADKPAGQWNTFFIRMVGERVTVELNGKLVVDNMVMENFWQRDKPIYPRGTIELQGHRNRLWFRNIYIREIEPPEANRLLGEKNTDYFVSTFNGTDLTGWEGATESYHVLDGAIVCKQGSGGTLYTQQECSNFIARVQYKLPPTGNNGLAIRYPGGQGNAHTEGMCEIQILDEDYPNIEGLDPRQLHGSVYGLVPAHQGYQRPPGQWNFQQVTVIGSQIKVELNGYEILAADLDEVRDSKDGEVYPNVRRPSGHFGFVGHSDPVAFRNVAIWNLAAERPEHVSAPVSPQATPIKLFNGHNLEGFYTWLNDSGYTDSRRIFTVSDGVIRISGDGYGGLITNRSYRDYHLVIEFRWGDRTWSVRKNRARDSGLLLHCHGPEAGYGSSWLASIEAQIIEGGCGDLLVLTGRHPATGQTLATSVTVETTTDRDDERVWKKGGTRTKVRSGRVNWWGRDVDWEDKPGFRGREDVESPHSEWTRMDVISDDGHLVYKVNEVTVNEAFDAKPDYGRILLQTEGAELFVRRYELWPLAQEPD